MKKECPEFVRNLSKKLTVQIPDISIVWKVIQKMSISKHCNLSRNCPEFVQVQNLSGKLICNHFLEHFPDNVNVRNLSSFICWNLSRIFYVWNLSSFICPEFAQNFFMFRICRICPEKISGIFHVQNLSSLFVQNLSFLGMKKFRTSNLIIFLDIF